ncbi:MAG: DUF2652 domain-containing protein [Chloroflexota bacterium]
MSHSPSPVERGYMLLADISGYTAFLTQTELEHAHEILTDLLETIVQRVKSLLTVHKIEGDCIFAHSREAAIIRGETLLELIEATYTDFRERMKNVRRHSTCTCRACQSIPMLDLKFMAHHGEYVVQHISGRRELAGSDVNLAHRLLKNHITERTGWRAYALFSQAALERTGLQLEGLMASTESYEYLGETRVFAMDLHARYEALLQARRVVVEPHEAIYTFSQVFNTPPPVVWSWLNEPEKRRLVAAAHGPLEFRPILRPGGRTAIGAITHCVHGAKVEMREKVLDWKPFDYFTVEQDNGPMGIVRLTFRLEPIDGSRTRLGILMTGRVPGWPDFIGRQAIRFVFTRLFNYGTEALRARDLIEQDAAVAPSGPLGP